MSLINCKADVLVGCTQAKTKKIPRRFRFYVFSFFMSIMMSGAMSLVMLWFEAGDLYRALLGWPGAWLLSLLIAFPVSLVAHRLSTKASHLILEP